MKGPQERRKEGRNVAEAVEEAREGLPSHSALMFYSGDLQMSHRKQH
jgi:hypothetical protein